MIDDNQIAFPSLGNLMLAVADYKIAGNNLKQNNQLTRIELDILHNDLTEKIAQKYKGKASLSSASYTLSSIAG